MLDSVPTVMGIGRDLLGKTEQVRTVQCKNKTFRTNFGIWYIENLVGIGHGAVQGLLWV